MPKTIKEADVKNKKVLLRVDFNIPISDNGKILDDFRIKAAIPTIQYLIKRKAKIIVISHLGRPDNKYQKSATAPSNHSVKETDCIANIKKLSLRLIAKHLDKLLKRRIKFLGDCIGEVVKKEIEKMSGGEIILLENLRFYDEEELNDKNFSRELASLADIYINDAFGASHRKHASIVGVTNFLPSFAGLLLKKEIDSLNRVIKTPKRPLIAVMGGAKLSTKLKLIRMFLLKADSVILGGALANTILKAKNLSVGKSVVDEEALGKLENLDITSTKLHLPVDIVTSLDTTGSEGIKIKGVGNAEKEEFILDIGPDSVGLFDSILKDAQTIIWNGPMGLFEVEKFAKGSEAVARSISSSKAYSVVGGGDTTVILNKLNILDKFNHVSTGGGAMLEYLAGEKLPGIEALEKRIDNKL